MTWVGFEPTLIRSLDLQSNALNHSATKSRRREATLGRIRTLGLQVRSLTIYPLIYERACA